MMKSLFIYLLLISSCSSPKITQPSVTVKSHLNNKIEILADSCMQLANWEKRDYTLSWNPYLNLQGGYRITRLGDTYDVFLKIVTKSYKPNAQNTYEYKKLPRVLLSKWDSCFTQVNESIISGGSKLRLHLAGYNEKHDMPFAVIMNQRSDVDESDHMWLYQKSCAELLKTSLHLLGLADETPTELYSCRAKSVSDSAMNDMEEALYNIKRRGFEYISYNCSCDRYTNNDCDQKLSKGYQAWGKDGNFSCPDGTYLIKKYLLKKDLWDWAQNNKAQVLDYYKRPFGELGMDLLCQAYGAIAGKYSHCTIASFNTLLKPAQFREILNPYCKSKNKDYSLCSQNAYAKKEQGCPVSIDEDNLCFQASGKWLE